MKSVSKMYTVVIAKLTKKSTATKPSDFSLKNWKTVLLETKNAIKDKNIGILAAGIAYFATLAFFPLMAGLVAIAALMITPLEIHDAVAALQAYLPRDIASLISTQLEAALENREGNIAVAAVAIVLSLFSVSGAVQNMIKATNVVYGVDETRGVVKLRLRSLVFTAASVVLGLFVVVLLLANKVILNGIGVPEIVSSVIVYLRWPLLVALMVGALATFYRYGPNRPRARWQWVSWGAVIATLLWMLVTVAFFIYSRYFANFSDTYSLFAGIIVLMLWLNLSAFIFLIGGAINYRLESKTVARTTKRK